MNSDEDLDEDNYCYYTREEREILRGVTIMHVKDEVRVIKDLASYDCTCLRTISFSKRLEVIGENVFGRCRSLRSINIPRAIRAINNWAFLDCFGLLMADLGNLLEMIGAGAFCGYRSLHGIDMPQCHKIYPRLSICILLKINNFDSQQRCCCD